MSLTQKKKMDIIFRHICYKEENNNYFVDVKNSCKVFLNMLETELERYHVEYVNNYGVMQFYLEL